MCREPGGPVGGHGDGHVTVPRKPPRAVPACPVLTPGEPSGSLSLHGLAVVWTDVTGPRRRPGCGSECGRSEDGRGGAGVWRILRHVSGFSLRTLTLFPFMARACRQGELTAVTPGKRARAQCRVNQTPGREPQPHFTGGDGSGRRGRLSPPCRARSPGQEPLPARHAGASYRRGSRALLDRASGCVAGALEPEPIASCPDEPLQAAVCRLGGTCSGATDRPPGTREEGREGGREGGGAGRERGGRTAEGRLLCLCARNIRTPHVNVNVRLPS